MLESLWYGRGLSARLAAIALWPLSLLFGALTATRRAFYRWGVLRQVQLPVPVIVVGNISVGGVGKTPLVVHIVERLQAMGLHPGIVSRGYGGQPGKQPVLVGQDTAVRVCGDEPKMLWRRTGAPVCVHPDRVAAAHRLVDSGVDVIVADDGLQHYRLGRAAEIAVLDVGRGLGNGLLLPAGPLREPPRRLRTVDLRVARGGQWPDALTMHVRGDRLRHVSDDRDGGPVSDWATRSVHAVAGIGHPGRFFDGLRLAGLHVKEHAFRDHHGFVPADLAFGDDKAVIMTEQDAVKCADFAQARWWYLPVSAVLAPQDAAQLDALLRRVADAAETNTGDIDGQETA